MSKEGYLQNKIRELTEKVNNMEEENKKLEINQQVQEKKLNEFISLDKKEIINDIFVFMDKKAKEAFGKEIKEYRKTFRHNFKMTDKEINTLNFNCIIATKLANTSLDFLFPLLEYLRDRNIISTKKLKDYMDKDNGKASKEIWTKTVKGTKKLKEFRRG